MQILSYNLTLNYPADTNKSYYALFFNTKAKLLNSR